MPRPKEPAVTDGISSEINLESVDSPTPEHMADLETAMSGAGLGNTPPEPVEIAPSAADVAVEDEPEAIEKPAPDEPVDPSAGKEGEDKALTQDEQEEKRRKELEALDLDSVTPPPNVSPRNLVNFDKLREVAKHYKAEAAKTVELEARLKELESHPASTLPEDIQKELEDHRRFRKIFDTEHDPEFNKQFNEKVSTLDEAVIDILKRKGLPADTEKELRALGLDKVSAQWWEESIFPKLSFVEREQIQKRLAERADTVDARAKEIEKYSSQREGYLAEHNQALVKQFESDQAEMSRHVDELTKEIPWARFMEIPATATAAERKQIEAHNAEVMELDTNFRAALYPDTPKARAEVAAAAAAAVRFSRDLTTAGNTISAQKATIEKLQKELEGIRTAGRLPASRPSSSRVVPSGQPDVATLPDEDAIERGLQEAEA